MSKAHQSRIVRDLTKSIRDEILREIKGGSIPDSWDGVELRQLLADKFAEATYSKSFMGRARMKEYRNTVITRNL
jgi:hypothetical protein